MHNFRKNYDKILEVLHQVEPKYDFLKQIRKPRLRDKELMAIGLTAEYMEQEKPYLDFDLTQVMLADKLKINTHNLSEVLTLSFGQNF